MGDDRELNNVSRSLLSQRKSGFFFLEIVYTKKTATRIVSTSRECYEEIL